jgi:hypothetical protein
MILQYSAPPEIKLPVCCVCCFGLTLVVACCMEWKGKEMKGDVGINNEMDGYGYGYG